MKKILITEIKKQLREMKIRKKSYLLDMVTERETGSIVYDTDLIRKLEVVDVTIHVLKWTLNKIKNYENKKET